MSLLWYSKTFWCLNHCTLPDFSRGPFKISSLPWFSKTPQWYTLVWGSWRFPVLGTWGLLSDLEPLSFGEFGGYYFFAPFHFSLLRLSRSIFSSSFSSNFHLFFFSVLLSLKSSVNLFSNCPTDFSKFLKLYFQYSRAPVLWIISGIASLFLSYVCCIFFHPSETYKDIWRRFWLLFVLRGFSHLRSLVVISYMYVYA